MTVVLLLLVASVLFGLAALRVSAPVNLTALGLWMLTIALLVGLAAPRIR